MMQRLAITITLGTLALAAAASFLPADIVAAATRQTGSELTPIYRIQGAGSSSPIARQNISTVGLVTGTTPEGFYLQDPAGDDNPQTSDGLYVYTHTRPSVQSGQCILVRDGYVQEFYGKTELSRVDSIEPSAACASIAIAPADLPPVRLGADPDLAFEPFEGMLVRLDGLDGYVHGPTKRFSSGEEEIAFLDTKLQPAVRGGRIFHTDASPLAALQYLSNMLGAELPAANWGDRLLSADDGRAALVGVLDYNFGKYQFLPLPDTILQAEPGQLRAETGLHTSAHDFTLCSFNVYGLGRGTEQYPDPVHYDAEIERRAHAIAETLAGCTIIALQETGAPTDAEALAARLSEQYGLPYLAVALPGPNTGDPVYPLTNSFLLRSDRVKALNVFSRQGCSEQDYEVALTGGDPCPPGQFPLFDRLPLVIDIAVSGEWGDDFVLRAINNHWKSKAGDERINAQRRLEQARQVAAIVQEQLDADPAAYVTVLGDLNDFYVSPPVDLLSQAPARLINALSYLAPADRYTYIFNGASQTLDHILISPNMVQLLSGVDAIHSNTNLASGGTGLIQTKRQVSDHDPVLVRIRPEGAAAMAGNAGFADMVIGMQRDGGSEQLAAVTDRFGDFRIWDVAPGAVTLTYLAPAWLELEQPASSQELPAGVTTLANPGVRHRSATLAAHAAVSVPFTIAAQKP